MNKFQVIAFDADDTLWENESFYTAAKSAFLQMLSESCDLQVVEQRLNETEIFNIRYYGYGIKSFILSMIETAIDLTMGEIEGRKIDQIIQLAKDVLTADVKLFEKVEETLADLSLDYSLMLITKGEQWEQERKIQQSGLAKYFRYIEVVGDKNEATYRQILGKYAIEPKNFLMVGNSIKSDILPVLNVGGVAVYIPYENTWFHELEIGEDANAINFDQLENIGLLPGYLRKKQVN